MQWSADSVIMDDPGLGSPGLGLDSLRSTFDLSQTVPKPLSPVMLSLLEDIIGQQGLSSFTPLDPSPSGSRTLFDLATPANNHATISPVALPPKPFVDRGIFVPRTEYAARRIASQASALAMQGGTVFIHHTHIASSPSLRDAFSASALHAMRNPANAPIVRGEIARRAAVLIDAMEAATARHPTLDIDVLHPVQALIIYQCIRLFSTADIAQQGQAERDGARLRAWVDRLKQMLHPLLAPSSADSQSWEAWIRDESVRRTVIFAELLAGIYTFLKYGWDDAHERMRTLEFTASAGLWEARSAVEWRMLRATNPEFRVAVETFDDDIAGAKPSALDDLSVAMRTINFGLESLEEWLAGDAVAMQKWGLRADSESHASYW
jgi:hypothetical protein